MSTTIMSSNNKLYKLFRKRLAFSEREAKESVQIVDELVQEAHKNQKGQVATKDFVTIQVKIVNDSINAVKLGLQGLEKKFHELAEMLQKLEERFLKLEERLQKLEERFLLLEERFQRLEERFQRLEVKFHELEVKLTKAIYWVGFCQFLGIIASIISIIYFMTKK